MNVALILSGGTGTRLGAEVPKQYIDVNGKPLLLYCMDTLSKSDYIGAIQIVAAGQWHESILSWLSLNGLLGKLRGFSKPGENRQLSIFNGLKDIKKYTNDDSCVLIHDAARPCLSMKMIANCFEALEEYDGVLPVLPMKDTVYMSKDGKVISSLLDRREIYAGQAPELFKLGKYYEANKALLPNKILEINGSTEPAVMAGMKITMIPGDEENFKITTQADLDRFKYTTGFDNL